MSTGLFDIKQKMGFGVCAIFNVFDHFRFPSKEEVMSFIVRTTKSCLKKQPRTLIIVGAYSIGKECVYIAISEALKVHQLDLACLMISYDISLSFLCLSHGI